MKVEKRGNSYRVQKMINGKRKSITFDHKPTQKEINMYVAAIEDENKANGNKLFSDAAKELIELKRNVVSPATIRTYYSKLKQISDEFKNLEIDSIDAMDVQAEINRLAASYSAKSVRDYHAFINSTLNTFRPDLRLNTKLPMKEAKKEPYIPTKEDIQKILEEVKGSDFELPIMLACYGMRVEEICAITADDLEGNVLHINKALVRDENNKWVIKATKTTASTRDIIVADSVRDLILSTNGYNRYPNTISRHLGIVEKKLGIPHFSAHKLRHYFASEAHAKGVPDADILKFGGWETDHVMKSVYRHSMNSAESVSNVISDGLF